MSNKPQIGDRVFFQTKHLAYRAMNKRYGYVIPGLSPIKDDSLVIFDEEDAPKISNLHDGRFEYLKEGHEKSNYPKRCYYLGDDELTVVEKPPYRLQDGDLVVVTKPSEGSGDYQVGDVLLIDETDSCFPYARKLGGLGVLLEEKHYNCVSSGRVTLLEKGWGKKPAEEPAKETSLGKFVEELADEMLKSCGTPKSAFLPQDSVFFSGFNIPIAVGTPKRKNNHSPMPMFTSSKEENYAAALRGARIGRGLWQATAGLDVESSKKLKKGGSMEIIIRSLKSLSSAARRMFSKDAKALYQVGVYNKQLELDSMMLAVEMLVRINEKAMAEEARKMIAEQKEEDKE